MMKPYPLRYETFINDPQNSQGKWSHFSRHVFYRPPFPRPPPHLAASRRGSTISFQVTPPPPIQWGLFPSKQAGVRDRDRREEKEGESKRGGGYPTPAAFSGRLPEPASTAQQVVLLCSS